MSARTAGPWRFRLVRTVDVSGTSGVGHVADGVRFHDGACVLRWRTAHTSTAVYSSLDDLVVIHGHGGATVVEWIDTPPSAAMLRGVTECVQDRCENVPFGSVGGVGARADLMRPSWISETDWPEYRAGYEAAAEDMYGADWRRCEFGWAHALTIGGAP